MISTIFLIYGLSLLLWITIFKPKKSQKVFIEPLLWILTISLTIAYLLQTN